MGLLALFYATNDHGSLLGLGDDDHPQYLKERASGGAGSEVPVHAHTSASGGTVDHGILTGLGDDDHPHYVLNDGEDTDIINGTFSLTTDDFGDFSFLNATSVADGYKIGGTTVLTFDADGNLLIGPGAGSGLTSGQGLNNILLGPNSGDVLTTEDNRFVVDNQSGTASEGILSRRALIYGIMAPLAEDQTLNINAETINIGTNDSGSVGTALNFRARSTAGQIFWHEEFDTFFITGGEGFVTVDITGSLVLSDFAVFDKASGKGIKVDTTTPTFGFRDLLGDIKTRPAAGGGTAALPDFIQYNALNIYSYRFGTNSPANHLHEAFIEFHVPHDYVPGTDIFLHTHWSQIVVDTGGPAGVPGNAKWSWNVTYAKGYDNGAFSVEIATSVIQQGSTTQYGHMIAEIQLSATSPSGSQLDSDDLEIDGLILVRVFRDPADGSDTLDQDTFLHFVDIHYQSTSLGTKDKNTPFYT